MPTTITIQQTADWARTKPSATKVLGAPITGWGGNAIPVKIANKVLQELLQEPFAWKWNRRKPAPFNTNALQQDYCTSITDVGWLESGDRIYIKNPSTTAPSAIIYPTRPIEAVRELTCTSAQGIPTQLCWIPNSEALCGTWAPSTLFTDPSANMQMPNQPLLQIRDRNGNIQVLTGYGTTGAVEPTWNTTKNQTTSDGSAIWTMADPDGIAWRINTNPSQAGTVLQIQPYYQKKPTAITTIGAVWTVPDDLSNVVEAGFMAYLWDAAEEDAKFEKSYMLFQVLIKKALRSGDRELDSFGMYPGRSLTGVGGGVISRGDQQYPPGLF